MRVDLAADASLFDDANNGQLSQMHSPGLAFNRKS